MFKSAKKAANEAPAADAPAAMPAAKKPRSGGLLKSLLPAIAGGSAIMLLTGATLWFQLVQNAGHATTEQILQSESLITAETLGNTLALMQQGSTIIARDPRIPAALDSGDPEQIRQLANQLAPALPDATSVRVIPLRQARKDDTSTPPISFAQMEMIKAAETGNAPIPEIHRAGERQFVSVATPVKRGETVIATVYTAFDFDSVKQAINKLPSHIGYLEWQQTFTGAPPLVVTAIGDASAKQGTPVQLDWGVPHWSLHTYPGTQNNPLAKMGISLLVIICLGSLLVAAAGIASFVLVNRTLQSNATTLAGHIQALFSRSKPTAHYSLGIFQSLGQSLEDHFYEYNAQHQPATRANDAKRATEPKDKVKREDPLDISLTGADKELLKAPSPLQKDNLDDLDSLDIDSLDLADHEPAAQSLPPAQLPAEIFRAYDIRGIVGNSLTPAIARLIGRAVGSQAYEAGQRGIIVARDGRLSSESLQQALIEGLIETGLRVIDIGMVPTPVLYFATHVLDTQSGVVVTGSHNPPDYNGFKIVINGTTLSGAEIQSLKTRIDQGRFSNGQGSYERTDILKDYRERITHDVVLAKPMRVVLDCGNGVGGVIAPQVLDRLGCTVTTLYGEVDGHFPNHHPDPGIAANLKALIDAVRHSDADLGIALDGDADRIGLVTKQGQIIWPDRLLMLFARDLLSRNPGADVLYDVKCTRDIVDLVSSLGGRAILCATGHSIMKAKMKETGAVVGGELSGHIFFNDRWYGFDDGIYAAARLLEILSMEPFDIDEVFAEFPSRVNTPEIQIPLSEARKFAVVEKLIQQGNFAGGNMVKTDGVRVDYPNGWGLIRASNTTPNLIARFEGDDEEALRTIQQAFREQLHNVEPGLTLPF